MKNKISSSVLVAFIGIILQVLIAPNIIIASIVPNFLLLSTLIIAINRGTTQGAIFGFSLGLAFDLLGVGPVGLMALIGIIVGYVAGLFKQDMSGTTWALQLLVLVFCAFLGEFSYALLLKAFGADTGFWELFVYKVIPSVLYNTAVALLLLPVFNVFLKSKTSSITVSKRF